MRLGSAPTRWCRAEREGPAGGGRGGGRGGTDPWPSAGRGEPGAGRRLALAHRRRRRLAVDGRDAQSCAGESAIVAERRSEVAEAHERHGPPAIETEHALALGLQPRDVVPDAPDAELAEVGEVLADLRRVEIEPIRQLLRGHGLHAVLFEL